MDKNNEYLCTHMDCGLSNTKDEALVVVTSACGTKIKDPKKDEPDFVIFILEIEFNKFFGDP